jgi:hypothetical protein
MTRKFWILWLLCALLSAFMIGLYQYAAYKSIRSNAVAHLQDLSKSKQTALQAQLGSAIGSLKEAVTYTNSTNNTLWNAETTNQFFDSITKKNPAIITLLMINANGMSVASNRPTLIGGNFKNTPRYKAISEHPDLNRIYISEPFSTPLGNYTIALGAMLPNKEGGFGGYILAIAAPAFFSEILSSDTAEYNVASALIHENGFVIFRVPDSDDREASDLRAYPDSAFWKFLKTGANDALVTALVPSTGLNNIVSYRRISFDGLETDRQLFLGLSIETDFLYEEWQKLGLELFAVWVLIVGLGGLFVAWKTQRLDV